MFRRLLAREPYGVPWRELVRVYRRLEARGEIRGGRFVAGMSGEQFALPEAVERAREIRRRRVSGELVSVSGADPLNLAGIVTGGERIAAIASTRVVFCDGIPVEVTESGQSRRFGLNRETGARIPSLKLPFRPFRKSLVLADGPFPAAVVYRRHAPAGARRARWGHAVLTLLGLASVVMTGLMTGAVVLLGVLVVKVLFFAVTLPFRIAFAVLFFPFWIAKTVLKLAVGVVMVPLLLLVGVVLAVLAALAAIAAIVAPLLPLLIVGLLVWAVFRSFRPAVA